MADDLELLLVQIRMDEAVLGGIIDGHQPKFALLVTSQDHAQPPPERTGKDFSQIPGPKFHVASHDVDTRRITVGPQVMTSIPREVCVARNESDQFFQVLLDQATSLLALLSD